MNKITLITSEGCLGCEVMRASIKAAIEKTNVDITVEEIDITNTAKETNIIPPISSLSNLLISLIKLRVSAVLLTPTSMYI